MPGLQCSFSADPWVIVKSTDQGASYSGTNQVSYSVYGYSVSGQFGKKAVFTGKGGSCDGVKQEVVLDGKVDNVTIDCLQGGKYVFEKVDCEYPDGGYGPGEKCEVTGNLVKQVSYDCSTYGFVKPYTCGYSLNGMNGTKLKVKTACAADEKEIVLDGKGEAVKFHCSKD